MLDKEYVRDSNNRIIGSKTAGLGGRQTIARDSAGNVIGRSSDVARITRNESGNIVSNNTSDVDLLFKP